MYGLPAGGGGRARLRGREIPYHERALAGDLPKRRRRGGAGALGSFYFFLLRQRNA